MLSGTSVHHAGPGWGSSLDELLDCSLVESSMLLPVSGIEEVVSWLEALLLPSCECELGASLDALLDPSLEDADCSLDGSGDPGSSDAELVDALDPSPEITGGSLAGGSLDALDDDGGSLDEAGGSPDDAGGSVDDAGASLEDAGCSLDDAGGSLEDAGCSLGADEVGCSLELVGASLDDPGASLELAGWLDEGGALELAGGSGTLAGADFGLPLSVAGSAALERAAPRSAGSSCRCRSIRVLCGSGPM